MKTSALLYWTALQCVLLSSSPAYCELVMVHFTTRHGARNVLPKTANLSESEATGGPSLLLQGREQAAAAGAAFQARYLQPTTCSNTTSSCLPPEVISTYYGLYGQPRVGFTNYNTLANSSSLDRTLATAYSFLGGLFPAPSSSPVPVYSVAETEDFRIRGYTRCPAYQRRLEEWYDSSEFKAKEQDTQDLRAKVAAVAPSLNTSLANWWNVFDAFNVWQTYGAGDPMPELDPQTYKQVMETAYWLELAKMRSNLTGNLLGGALLGDILLRLDQAVVAWQAGSERYYRLLPTFGHYNTQLGLLAALGLDQYTPAAAHPWLSKKIPAAAAVLALELHCNRSSDRSSSSSSSSSTHDAPCWVRLVAQDGPDKQYNVITLPCSAGSVPPSLEGACSYGEFVGKFGSQALRSAAEWCEACRNKATNACKAALAERALGKDAGSALTWSSPAGSVSDGGSSSSSGGGGVGGGDNGLGWKIAVAVIASVVGTAAIAAAVAMALHKRYHRSQMCGTNVLLPGYGGLTSSNAQLAGSV